MDRSLWTFRALDRLFFRDGRPMSQGEMSWVESQFPPTGRTLQGAIRTAVIRSQGESFDRFREKVSPLNPVLGDAGSLGALKLTGPFLSRGGELLFPAPLDLLRAKEGGFARLDVDLIAGVSCDLGQVCLPRAPGPGFKTLGDRYITKVAMADYLAGDIGGLREPSGPKDGSGTVWRLYAENPDGPGLVDREQKIGLARDDGRRTADEGKLYSIAFCRPRTGVALSVLVEGLEDALHPPDSWVQPLGGEAKLAELEIQPVNGSVMPARPALQPVGDTVRFRIVFTTPALFSTDGTSWLPPGFSRESGNGPEVWSGTLKWQEYELKLEVVSACIGKPVKVGGWDLVNRKPRPLTCHLPAGSVLFCRAPAASLNQVEQLHDAKLGRGTEYGFGHTLIGTW